MFRAFEIAAQSPFDIVGKTVTFLKRFNVFLHSRAVDISSDLFFYSKRHTHMPYKEVIADKIHCILYIIFCSIKQCMEYIIACIRFVLVQNLLVLLSTFSEQKRVHEPSSTSLANVLTNISLVI